MSRYELLLLKLCSVENAVDHMLEEYLIFESKGSTDIYLRISTTNVHISMNFSWIFSNPMLDEFPYNVSMQYMWKLLYRLARMALHSFVNLSCNQLKISQKLNSFSSRRLYIGWAWSWVYLKLGIIPPITNHFSPPTLNPIIFFSAIPIPDPDVDTDWGVSFPMHERSERREGRMSGNWITIIIISISIILPFSHGLFLREEGTENK